MQAAADDDDDGDDDGVVDRCVCCFGVRMEDVCVDVDVDVVVVVASGVTSVQIDREHVGVVVTYPQNNGNSIAEVRDVVVDDVAVVVAAVADGGDGDDVTFLR